MVPGGDLITNLKHTVETGDFLLETSSADPRGSYIHWWARADSNCRPPACQADALTN